MHTRCNNPAFIQYANYGGRGIRVCKEWGDYSTFKVWALANGYQPGLQIDRERNGDHYDPTNCRWVTQKTNARNKRDNRLVDAFGEIKTLAHWADDYRCAVTYHTLKKRLNRCLPPELAITARALPMGKYRRATDAATRYA